MEADVTPACGALEGLKATLGVVAGTLAGNRVLRRIPEGKFRPVLAVILILIGTVVTTALVNFDVNIDLAIGKILDGSIKPESYVLGFNENGIGLAGYGKFENKISSADKTKIQAIVDEIKAGKTQEAIKEEIRASLAKEPDALEDVTLPRDQRENAKQYFERLRKGE